MDLLNIQYIRSTISDDIWAYLYDACALVYLLQNHAFFWQTKKKKTFIAYFRFYI